MGRKRDKRTVHCFRDLFKDGDPPFPFTWVSVSIFTGAITTTTPTAEDMKAAGPGVGNLVDDLTAPIPHVTLSEREIDDVVFMGAKPMKANTNANIPYWTTVTEKEFVMSCAFKAEFLSRIRVNLMDHLKYARTPAGVILPPTAKDLMVKFERVEPHRAGTRTADIVMMRHKIIKHVLEDLCPFAKVILNDTLELEMSLRRCLPMGSSNKGNEIFRPPEEDSGGPRYHVLGDAVMIRGSDFTVLPFDEREEDVVYEDELAEGVEYLDWDGYDVLGKGNDVVEKRAVKPDEFFHDKKGQMAFVRSQYVEGQTDGFFSTGAVVFERRNELLPFVTVDFSNFYASVAIKFNLDPYVTKVLMRMTALRGHSPGLKQWIVTLLGKSKHLNELFFNAMKALSVAVVLATIRKNGAAVVVGATTDGFQLDARSLPSAFLRPAGFPMKTEFVPDVARGMLTVNSNCYVGVSAEDGSMFHRGFIGRLPGGHPEWYKRAVDVVLEHCLGHYVSADKSRDYLAVSTDKMMTALGAVLSGGAAEARDFVLPSTLDTVRPTADKHPVMEYLCNDLCVGMHQFFAVVDDYILPTACSAQFHTVPQTLSGYHVKQLNVAKYVEVFRSKMEKIAEAFSTDEGCVAMCGAALTMTQKHIETVLDATRSAYPGGVGDPVRRYY